MCIKCELLDILRNSQCLKNQKGAPSNENIDITSNNFPKINQESSQTY